MIVTIKDGFYIPARGDIITLDTVGNKGFNLEYIIRLSSILSENSKIIGTYETQKEAEHYIRDIAEYVINSFDYKKIENCSICKWYGDFNNFDEKECLNDSITTYGTQVKSDFYCNKFEAKQ